MAQLTINLPNSEIATIPDWKLDTEIENMAKAMTLLSKTMKEDNAKLIKAITGGTGNNKTANDASNNTNNKESKKAEKEKTEETKKATKEVGKFRGGMAVGVGVVTNALGGLSVAASVVAAGLTSITLGTIFDFGTALNRLTNVGLNTSEAGFMDGSMRLMQFGMSLDQATDFTISASNAMQNIGVNGVTNLLREFDELTVKGSKFGIGLDDNLDIFREEIKFATRMGNLRRLDEKQQSRLINNTKDLLATQVKYTGALGETLETIRTFALQTLESSTDFQARLLLGGEQTRQTMLKGAQEFVSVLRATGGTLGGELAAAAIEAGSFGAIGFSEAAKRFITVLPSLSAGFNNVIRGFNNGLMDGEQAALQFTNILGSLSDSEKRRIFAIARTGDQQALVMAKGIMQFEKSFDKISELGNIEPEQLQTVLNLLNASGKQMASTLSAIKNKFILSFIQGFDLEKFNKAFGAMQSSVTNLAYTLFGFTKKVTTAGEEIEGSGGIITKLADNIPVLIGKFTAKLDGLNKRIENYYEGGKDLTTTLKDILLPAFKELFSFLGFEFGLLIKEMMIRLGNEMTLLDRNKKTDKELSLEIAEMKKNRRELREANVAYIGSDAQLLSNQRRNQKSFTGPRTLETQDKLKYNVDQQYPGIIRGAFAGDHNGQRFFTGQGSTSRPENIKTYSLGSNKLTSTEQLMFDEYKKLGSDAAEALLKANKVRLPNGSHVGDSFKNSFDTDGIDGLSGSEFKAYLETLIMLTKRQTKVVEKAAE